MEGCNVVVSSPTAYNRTNAYKCTNCSRCAQECAKCPKRQDNQDLTFRSLFFRAAKEGNVGNGDGGDCDCDCVSDGKWWRGSRAPLLHFYER